MLWTNPSTQAQRTGKFHARPHQRACTGTYRLQVFAAVPCLAPCALCHRQTTFSPPVHLPPHPPAPSPLPTRPGFFAMMYVACPRARTAAAKHSCIVDAGPSLARRRRLCRFAGRCGCPPRRAQNTRTNHEPRFAHPHSHDTTHRPRTATGARHPGRAARALRLPGPRRGRRTVPASTSTTGRHNQPA